jgi:hypothetical protein
MKKIIFTTLIIGLLIGCKQPSKKNAVKKIQDKEVESTNGPEWVSLFDGKTFKGWHLYMTKDLPHGEWSIEDGAMLFNPKKDRTEGGKNIVTDNDYTNFKLSLEWKISKGGNSGIFWGVKEDPKYKEAYETGPEIQVLDNQNHPDANISGKLHQAGALYDMVAPSQDVAKPYGEWNKCVIYINHKTNEGKVWLNDVKIVEFPVDGEGWGTMVANSKFKDWEGFGKTPTGKIGLQDHGNKVWYRNIKIQELD